MVRRSEPMVADAAADRAAPAGAGTGRRPRRGGRRSPPAPGRRLRRRPRPRRPGRRRGILATWPLSSPRVGTPSTKDGAGGRLRPTTVVRKSKWGYGTVGAPSRSPLGTCVRLLAGATSVQPGPSPRTVTVRTRSAPASTASGRRVVKTWNF
ncbi:hypothetical protein EQG64_26155 [Streptomyces sp. S6]|nr:hypothetical protein EQG64_26155 [Streptomyces sp. S6]